MVADDDALKSTLFSVAHDGSATLWRRVATGACPFWRKLAHPASGTYEQLTVAGALGVRTIDLPPSRSPRVQDVSRISDSTSPADQRICLCDRVHSLEELPLQAPAGTSTITCRLSRDGNSRSEVLSGRVILLKATGTRLLQLPPLVWLFGCRRR